MELTLELHFLKRLRWYGWE